MRFLQVADNRTEIATALASLPAKIQILANSPLLNPCGGPHHQTRPRHRPTPVVPVVPAGFVSETKGPSGDGMSGGAVPGQAGPGEGAKTP